MQFTRQYAGVLTQLNFHKEKNMSKMLYKIKAIALSTVLASVMSFSAMAATAPASSAFTPAQQKAMGPLIEQYLLKHPEILMKMSNALREQQMQQMQAEAKKTEGVLLKNKSLLAVDKNSVTRGSKTAPITLVEFYDYQCSACAATYPQLEKFLDTDFAKQNVRVVYRSFPFFGPASVYAAKMVIAAKGQGKGIALHQALFKSGLIEGKLSKKAVNKIAAGIKGLNMAKLKKAMQASWVKKEMAANSTLTKDIHLNATPGFIFHPTNVSKINKDNLVFINSGMGADGFLAIAKKVKTNI